MRVSGKTIVGLALLATTLANAQDRSPLGDYKKKFLGQRVVVNQDNTPVSPSWQFFSTANWQFVKEKKGIYTIDGGPGSKNWQGVPLSFAGQSGIIVAVVGLDGIGGTALSAQTDETYVQSVEVIVKMDSGQLIENHLLNMMDGDGILGVGDFTLSSVLDQHKGKAVALAQKLIGKFLYLTALTGVYDMGLTIQDAELAKSGSNPFASAAQIYHAPLLTPLPVLTTAYSDKFDLFLVTLQLPSGPKAQYVAGLSGFPTDACIDDELTAKKYSCATTSMPTFLTDREIDAIRTGSVFIGMSKPAVYMCMGLPQKINSSVVGSTQLVYRSAYIYVQDNKVVEVQNH